MVSADAISASLTKAGIVFTLQSERQMLIGAWRKAAVYTQTKQPEGAAGAELLRKHPQASRACSKIRPDPRGTHFGSGCTIADGVETADLKAAKAHLNSLQ
jgi:hypothetical protein